MRSVAVTPTGTRSAARASEWSDLSRTRRRHLVLLGVLSLVLVVLARGYLVATFVVPTASMRPSIEPGDRLLVDRTIDDDHLSRGDIVVFDGTRGFASPGRSPHQAEGPVARTMAGLVTVLGLDLGERDYVKRVVGLPGDRVACCDSQGRVTVNGVGIDEDYLFDGERPSAVSFDVVVPAERIWVMGDYRSRSTDSRSFADEPGHGMVAVDNIVGRATARFWPLSRAGTLTAPPQLARAPRGAHPADHGRGAPDRAAGRG